MVALRGAVADRSRAPRERGLAYPAVASGASGPDIEVGRLKDLAGLWRPRTGPAITHATAGAYSSSSLYIQRADWPKKERFKASLHYITQDNSCQARKKVLKLF